MSGRTEPIGLGQVDSSFRKQQPETAFELEDFAFHPAVRLWFVTRSQSLTTLCYVSGRWTDAGPRG